MAGLFILLTGCSEDNLNYVENAVKTATEQSHLKSVEDAVADVMEWVGVIYGDELTTKSEAFAIANVSAIYDDEPMTKGSAKNQSSPLLYKVRFKGGGSAFAGADDRSPAVLAIMEKEPEDGVMDDYLLDKLCFAARQVTNEDGDVIYVDGISVSRGNNDKPHDPNKREIKQSVGPLLKTKWAFGHLNDLCPNLEAGCGPVAVGQLLSYFKYPSSVTWSGSKVTMDWNLILKYSEYDGRYNESPDPELSRLGSYTRFGTCLLEPAIKTGSKNTVEISKTEKMVATLLRWLGDKMGAHYNSHGTGVTSGNLRNWFKNNNFTVTDWKKFKESTAVEWLNSGKPFIMSGSGENTEGHFWVIDGYRQYYSTKYGYEMMLHCNWGWSGSCNGYFLTNNFNCSSGWCMNEDGEYEEFVQSQDNEHYTDNYMLKVTR